MSNNIEQYLTIFVHSKQYLIISGNIYQYLTISNNIEQDSKLFCTPYDIIHFWNFLILFSFSTWASIRGAFAPKNFLLLRVRSVFAGGAPFYNFIKHLFRDWKKVEILLLKNYRGIDWTFCESRSNSEDVSPFRSNFPVSSSWVTKLL